VEWKEATDDKWREAFDAGKELLARQHPSSIYNLGKVERQAAAKKIQWTEPEEPSSQDSAK